MVDDTYWDDRTHFEMNYNVPKEGIKTDEQIMDARPDPVETKYWDTAYNPINVGNP